MGNRWLVVKGGEASAASTIVLSRHKTWETAQRRAGKMRIDGTLNARVEHADVLEAAIAGGTEAVQALAGRARNAAENMDLRLKNR